MKCPSCGYENRKRARFCQGCGAALEGESITRPLPAASVAFAPLPEGALLHDGQYEVVEVRTTNERLNVYVAEDTALVRPCPNCQTEVSDAQEQFCPSCGADLSGIEPLYLRYRIQESADEQAFAVEAQLLGMDLEHAGLLLPREVFVEAPYGPPRHYMVEPEFSPPLATSLSVPQGLNQVLGWGISLAQALDHLHRHNVTLGEVVLNHVAIAGKQALWTHLGTAHVASPAPHAMATSDFAQDVQGLGTVLVYLATGEQQAAQVELPEQAAATFSQALTTPTTLTAAAFATALDAALQELRRPTSVILVVGRRTDVGQERALNEDSLLTLDVASVFRSASVPVGLFAVADGMGGHEAGDVASRLAIQAIARRVASGVLPPAVAGEPLPNARQWLTATALAANRAVYDHRKSAGTDMGTTLVMAIVVGDVATIANVGDSRAYLLDEAGIVQITTDHSLVERLVATGQLTPEEAAHHPQRNIIYRVMGDKPQVEVDLFERRLAPGEALLFCSDGLSGMVPDRQIWQIWHTSTSPQDACDRLVEAANQAGGEDNVTVVILQVVG
ncbi:MAG TPA: Stp1/IreP family PP2C-type Ser/Thr phosphatase [Anaerolineae bacterium]|nr:Stp1/IreP family PP2C-type Ser/Thr phosphatase [Anaerolineae bacterium]